MANPNPKPGPGRPKGTPNKATKEIKEIARIHGPAMIAELVRLAGGAESEAARVAAIKEVLDRGYGKAQQGVTVDGNVSLLVGTGVPRAERD